MHIAEGVCKESLCHNCRAQRQGPSAGSKSDIQKHARHNNWSNCEFFRLLLLLPLLVLVLVIVAEVEVLRWWRNDERERLHAHWGE